MNRLLITGSGGFIGTHLLDSIEKNKYNIVYTDKASRFDVTLVEEWKKLPHADCVIHLAGKSFVPNSWAEPGEFIRSNLNGTINALEYCKANKARLIFISSYLYGDTPKLPTPETSPITTPNPYAFSKSLSEDVCRFYSEKLGTKIVILRLFNVYGPRQSDNFLIPMIIRQIMTDKSVVVKDLLPRRDYVYVKDVISAIIQAISFKEDFGIFNIGSGKSYSVEYIIKSIQDIMNVTTDVVSLNERRIGEIMDTVADISLAQSKLGWVPQWDIERGLKETILFA